jgi:FKBP-type peptidyl-prolyl cis-trans isomerase
MATTTSRSTEAVIPANAGTQARATRSLTRLLLAALIATSLATSTEAARPGARAAATPAWTRATARAYLAEHRTVAGVVETRSGLQYRVLTEGAGCRPKKGSDVRVHYTLQLAGDDVLVDDSRAHGGAQAVSLADMIPAWQEGIPLMHVGSVVEFTVPPALAYGAKGLPGKVPANAVLVFAVELVAAKTCAK